MTTMLPAGESAPLLPHVLLAMATILLVARAVGLLFARLRQPPVMGEVMAGILLGPSLLGRIAPEAGNFLLPPAIEPQLGVLSQFGIVLYMFLVGLELDLAQVRKRPRATIAIAQASIVVPFVLGAIVALPLHAQVADPGVPRLHFALFFGVAMSVTAFPVLARILSDRGAQTTEIGVLALACAAINDVMAWCLLALVVGITHSDAWGGAVTAALAIAYVLTMLFVVRPAVLRFVAMHERAGRLDRTRLAVVLAALLLSALATEAIGVHALFGAFLLGALVPADSALARELLGRLEDFVVVLFLPAFFAFTGMRTELGLLRSGHEWMLCGVIVLVACLGKFGGTYVAARLQGLPARPAAGLGVLMNTRGLMELIVLNVGLDLGILTPSLFAMFVVMALLTTFATTPLLDRLDRGAALWRGPTMRG